MTSRWERLWSSYETQSATPPSSRLLPTKFQKENVSPGLINIPLIFGAASDRFTALFSADSSLYCPVFCEWSKHAYTPTLATAQTISLLQSSPSSVYPFFSLPRYISPQIADRFREQSRRTVSFSRLIILFLGFRFWVMGYGFWVNNALLMENFSRRKGNPTQNPKP